jgi:hypothetical protein
MRALAAVVLAALHFAAASLPCAPSAEDAQARDGRAGGALHATHFHAAPAEAAELRAPSQTWLHNQQRETEIWSLGLLIPF